MAGSSASTVAASISTSTVDLSDHLPLRLTKSETIPPAPNLPETGSTTSIDWLPDFAGHSWVAYGASSLLVVHHVPSPLSPEENKIGPLFRQVFELSSIYSVSDVTSVSWCPAIPSNGDLAAAADNCIFLFGYDSEEGCFCWSQTHLLVQSTKVEAIKWTGSGNGVIAGGIDVVLWKRNGKSWEKEWKLEMKHAQTLVSTTWSIEGPSATSASRSKLQAVRADQRRNSVTNPSNCVNVCYRDGKYGYSVTDLQHPQPVLMIQWRPSSGRHQTTGSRRAQMYVLLTCCLDGSVRLWSEIGDGRPRKNSKDANGAKISKRLFCVVGILEINQLLNGSLGSNISMTWATEMSGLHHTGEEAEFFPAEGHQHDQVGRCDWLIGLGPGRLITFWSVHFLEDVNPTRPPRVTLWRKQELPGSETRNSCDASIFCSRERSFSKVAIMRRQVFGPPTVCSLIELLPSKFLCRSILYKQASATVDSKSSGIADVDSYCESREFLNIGGHTSKILQVAVHSCNCETEVAVSLDSNGLLLFWSLSPSNNCISGLPSLNPSWKLLGKLVLEDLSPHSVSINWAPSWSDEDYVLLSGHGQGIDCLLIRTSKHKQEKLLHHKLCTIPLINDSHAYGPDKVFSVPLQSTCKPTFKFNEFMIIATWMEGFQAVSCRVTLDSHDISESCSRCPSEDNVECSTWIFHSQYSGKRYHIFVNPCSRDLQDYSAHDQVTSVDMVSPSILMSSLLEKWHLTHDIGKDYFPYHMATGHYDGRVRLWKSSLSNLSLSYTPWELVGVFTAHEGPVTALSLADCGQRIATVSAANQLKGFSVLCVWEAVCLAGGGCFRLEDEISLNERAISLRWLVIGNGQLFLGVCLQNDLLVYAQRCYRRQALLKPEKCAEASAWFCISVLHTSSAIFDFLWGPRVTIVVIHEEYFSIYSQWSFLIDKKHLAECHPTQTSLAYFTTEMGKGILPVPFIGREICNFKNLLLEESSRACKAGFHSIMETGDVPSCLHVDCAELKKIVQAKIGFLSMLEVAQKLCGPLPFYHPEVLLINIYSGNWKRAYAALQHLVECTTSSSASQQKCSTSNYTPVIKQIELSKYYEGASHTCDGSKGFQWSRDASSISLPSYPTEGLAQFSNYSDALNVTPSSTASSSDPSGFSATLERLHALAIITTVEKIQTLGIIDLLHEIKHSLSSSAYESLDEPGRRFWCTVRLQQLDFLRKESRMPSTEELSVDSRLMSWAFHSGCQENLFSAFLPGEPSWQEMRNMGIGFWFTNVVQLRAKMEKLARAQYLKDKDPKACTLLYVALNRLKVLAGLFKVSKNEKDKLLIGFLSRNFEEEKNKAAALKNAYVLMGRHQLEMAIAFFLLGGDTTSAVTVCAKNLGDEQLALVLCRLVEGQSGPLEHHLISKCILPAAIEKGDHWRASVLQWLLGNHYQSILLMLGLYKDSCVAQSADPFELSVLVDPSVGQYCQMLAAKTSLRNAVGERNAAILCRWATIVTATSLSRCGLPLEALECISSSAGLTGVAGGTYDVSENLPSVLRPDSADSSNWLACVVALQLEKHAKSELAMQYLSKLLWEHPSWLDSSTASKEASAVLQGYDMNHYRHLHESFQQKLNSAVRYVEQKFSLDIGLLLNKIVVSSNNFGLLLIGYHTLQGFASQGHLETSHVVSFPITCDLGRQMLDATAKFSCLFSQFITICGIATFHSTPLPNEDLSIIKRSSQFHALRFYMDGLITSLSHIRAVLMMLYVTSSEDFINLSLAVIDLCKYCVYFPSVILLQDFKALLPTTLPPFVSCNSGYYFENDVASMKGVLSQVVEFMGCKPLDDFVDWNLQATDLMSHGQGDDGVLIIPDDEKRKLFCVCLWQYVSTFMNNRVEQLCGELRKHVPHASYPTQVDGSFPPPSTAFLEPGDVNILQHICLSYEVLAESMRNTVFDISSYNARRLAAFLWQKVTDGDPVPTLLWLEEFLKSDPSGSHAQHPDGREDAPRLVNEESSFSISELVGKITSDPSLVIQTLEQSGINLSELAYCKPFFQWKDLHMAIVRESDSTGNYNHKDALGSSSVHCETSSPAIDWSQHVYSPSHSDKREASLPDNIIPFQSPRETFKKTGELLEALCVNSVDQRQVAVAGNRKGIIFFNWDDGLPFRDQSDYIWSDADWPRNGWAGADSTPVPTCVSPGIGLGNKEGAHLGLGGTTVGVGSVASPGRDLTGGGAFGIPGYAGIGASGLGWEIQEDFDNFVDPPATLENISARALASHPLRPLFLAGSINTHIYLWEFGKETAAATYGVLPAANVPPPYALASVTALQFDRCGNRFANAASDGTVCTWQLEVGGRCNVRPTESTLCFNGHAMDVCYVASSACILAAAGYSSNGVNVVIWDTLAPPSTSRASVMCHEGGASSIDVFDHDLGGCSISPLIITGGKSGDIGLHDFRYMATGKTKRQRHPNLAESVSDAPAADMRSGRASNMGDHNRNGMLWYIPKAHSGPITKIASIPDTSLFLTGSKDGDVKLWDAKTANMVYQWPKLHERHTFLQRGSQSFGGVTRVAVTDIKSVPNGFLSCGGDGSVKSVQLNDFHSGSWKH